MVVLNYIRYLLKAYILRQPAKCIDVGISAKSTYILKSQQSIYHLYIECSYAPEKRSTNLNKWIALQILLGVNCRSRKIGAAE
jgi:hypothetical protein